MWIFTKYGFFSVVCARREAGNWQSPVDETRVMVRARLRPHLEALRKRFNLGCRVQTNSGSDYRYRLFMAKERWTEIATELAAELDYDNFKNAAADHLGRDGADYIKALHEVWEEMVWLQQEEPVKR